MHDRLGCHLLQLNLQIPQSVIQFVFHQRFVESAEHSRVEMPLHDRPVHAQIQRVSKRAVLRRKVRLRGQGILNKRSFLTF